MKRNYGSFFSRLAWGGSNLSPAELKILDALVSTLPVELRQVVETQFDAYNLVQRETDGRALNFYRRKDGKPNSMIGLPLLKHKGHEAPLARIAALLGGNATPLHAALTAVDGRAFSLTLNRKLEKTEHNDSLNVQSVVHAWRSNFEVTNGDA